MLVCWLMVVQAMRLLPERESTAALGANGTDAPSAAVPGGLTSCGALKAVAPGGRVAAATR